MTDTDRSNSTSMQEQLDIMKREVDSLQIALTTPWYKQASTIVAALALLFSFGTTLVSAYSANEQEKHAYQAELRSLVQKLIQIPIRQVEFSSEYGEQAFISSVSGLYNQEGLLLARQAVKIAEKIPNRVSAQDYLAIANIFFNAGEFSELWPITDLALKRPISEIDRATVYRIRGVVRFSERKPDEGRKMYQKAIQTLNVDNDVVIDDVRSFTNSQTYFFLAQQEALYGFCDYSEKALLNAEKELEKLPNITKTPQLGQFARLRAQGCPLANNNTVSPVSNQ